ncbi:ABC transporter substrate-binding protein [Amycolatopsis anabasis]|uniref:ABC transporter substrate-binding protein n=1 Tax=Amycolatopsis anabasis TaxID=1840409 RepID=UPI00131B2EB8|nr:ABC transporter substrate-binding protein [Amycolatopsis anabasis]
MKTILIAALFTFTLACDGSGGTTLRVGTLSDSPPNMYQENGNYTGFDNELLKAIAAKQSLELEFAATDFSALLGRVASGEFAIGSSAISQTEERKKTVDFSDAYNFQTTSIQTREGVPITDENSLPGKRVCVTQATVSDFWVTSTVPQALIVRFPDVTAGLSALKTGAVDACVLDQSTAEKFVALYPEAKLKVTKSFTTGVSHGYAVRKGNAELRDKINAGLRQVIADGTWEELHQRFLPTEPVPDQFKAGKSK